MTRQGQMTKKLSWQCHYCYCFWLVLLVCRNQHLNYVFWNCRKTVIVLSQSWHWLTVTMKKFEENDNGKTMTTFNSSSRDKTNSHNDNDKMTVTMVTVVQLLCIWANFLIFGPTFKFLFRLLSIRSNSINQSSRWWSNLSRFEPSIFKANFTPIIPFSPLIQSQATFGSLPSRVPLFLFSLSIFGTFSNAPKSVKKSRFTVSRCFVLDGVFERKLNLSILLQKHDSHTRTLALVEFSLAE